MVRPVLIGLMLVGSLTACSSSPDAPVNQTGPIRSMDSFFSGGRTDYPPPRHYRYDSDYPPPRQYDYDSYNYNAYHY